MSRFLRIFAVFFSLVFVGNAFGAGYTCSTKQYTSCKTNYYLTSSSAGNSCALCSDASNNSSTQSGTESCTRSCSISNGTCSYSGSTRTYTDTCNGNYTGGSGGSTVGTGTCTGCSSYTRTSTGTCSGGTCTVNSCTTDYYASGCSCTSVGNGYYSADGATNRTQCTNTKPTNSSYSGSGGGENNCPWRCNANYYLKDGSCSACSSATFSRNVTESCSISNGTGTRTNVETCYYTGGPAGAESALDCTGETGCSVTSTGTCYVTSCNSGYHANASNTACVANVKITCAPGTYLAADATTCATCPSGAYYCPGGDFSQSSSIQGRKTCPSGYTSVTAAGKRHISECAITCAAGRRVTTPGGICLSTVPSGGWFTTNSTHTVGYGQVSPVYYCPNNFDKQAATSYSQHVLASAACKGTLSKGHLGQDSMRVSQIKIENLSSSTPVQLVEVLAYTSTGAQVATSKLSIDHLYKAETNDNQTVKDNAATISQLIIKYGSLEDIDPLDYSIQLYPGGRIVLNNAVSSTLLSYIILALKVPGYIRNYTSANTTPETMQLKVSVYDYQYKVWHVILDTSSRSYNDLSSYLYTNGITMMAFPLMGESPCPKGKYYASARTVTGATIAAAGCTACENWTFASSTGSTSCTACPTATDGWTKASGTGWISYTSCKQTKNATDISSYCTDGVLTQTALSATSWGTASASTAFQAAPGSIVSGSGTSTTCTQCSGAVFSPGGAETSCTACPAQTSGWTRATGTGWSSYADCYQTQTPANCASGTIKQIGSGTTTWGASELVTALSANANSYINGLACYTCASKNSEYPNSAGGAIDHTSCYSGTKSREWSGSETACSKPSNCASVTCNSCSNDACDYVAYLNSEGTGDGTIKSGCSSNSAACQQTVKSVTANANYYVDGTTCPACSSFSSTYKLSDGGNISSNYCYQTVTKTGSQNDPAMLTGCAARTLSACTPGSCSYKDYYNATDGSCTPADCTKGQTCTSASADYYLDSGVAKQCSAYNATYPDSDGGNIDYKSCYKTVTKTGNQNNGATPAGCASVTAWNTCTPGTCNYKDYNGATDGSCTPADCVKDPKTVTANANYYVSGATCPACPTAYPSSDGGNIGEGNCYVTGTKYGTQNDPAMPTGCAARTLSACNVGSCNYRDYKTATDTTCTPADCTKGQTCTSASADYYLDSGVAKQCSAYNATYPDSDGGNIDYKSCYKTVTKTGNQNNGATPAGCASVTAWNTCTPGTCNYKDYNGATDGSCTPADCVKDPKTVTANANYYVSGVTCPACSSKNSGYPYSAGGNISYTSCYSGTKSRTWSGSQTACSKPANSASYSCDTCAGAACDYVAYLNSAGTGDGTIKSGCSTNTTACQQNVKSGSVTCNTGFYTSGVTCPACTNKPDNSAYTGTATSNACPWECNNGYGQTSANLCAQMCTAGFQHLKSSTGVSIPLYTSAQTTHSIVVQSQSGAMCYASLASGAASGAINVNLGGTTYHAIK